MQVTVIIPNYNGERLLPGCLNALARQTRPARKIIVVDNGGGDGSIEIAAAHPLRPEVIELGRNLGFAAAANRGIAAASTAAVALLNNDAEADPRWIEAGLGMLESDPAVAMAASLMLDYFERGRVDNAGDALGRDGRPRPRGRGRPAAEFREAVEALSPCAGAGFYRASLFAEIGGFEESFFAYLEDLDFGLRARAAGHACRFAPGAVVYHRGAATVLADRPGKKPVDSSDRVAWIARNRVRLLGRNFPASYLARWSPALVFGLARSAVYHLIVSGQGRAFARGLAQGLRRFPGDRAFYRGHARPGAFADTAEVMVRGERPWET